MRWKLVQPRALLLFGMVAALARVLHGTADIEDAGSS